MTFQWTPDVEGLICRYLYFFEIWLIEKASDPFFHSNSVVLGEKAAVTNEHGKNS